ncbi:TolB amino-terminal domain-containing protein [Roseivivax lentus]|uniref:TolB amino-terminal domain-containing protein n=1 Tax=Roseivivax lentus TaxID=633194 RepID=A0A1N7PLR5_9RHOB|nr:tetratricopeptide repeat protein [Roseivivax lentus]SIT11542.1 TolB amino-terminal domain-containing protein [Roseivivax lentus]
MPRVVLHLSGSFRAEREGIPLEGLSRRAQGLLAYLGCQPAMRAERSALADLLWSDRGESQARASLRQELSVLRKALGDAVEANRQAVWLVPDHVEIRHGPGVFLQGFDLQSEGFEDWLRAQRQMRAAPLPAHAPVAAAPQGTRPTLAVLPFSEIGAPETDMFAEGIVEEITGALSRSRDFNVIARQSTFALRDAPLSVPDIAERLGADYLLEGSVRRSGDRVRISVQLVSGGDGHTRWAERFDDRLDDLFDLQDRIAAHVAGQLSPNLRAAEILRARRQPPEVRSSYDLVLTSMPHFWVHDPEENRRALALLDRAVEKDPESGHAHAMKAWCHAHECCYLWTLKPDTARAAARAAFDRALPRAGDNSATMTALSAVAALALRDFSSSEDLAVRAVELDPNNAWAFLRLGWVEVYLGRHESSLGYFDRAQELSPLDPFLFNIDFGRSAAVRAMGRYDEAVALIERGLRAAPKAHWAYRMLFGTLWLKGDRDRAIEAGRKWLAAHPGLSTETLLEGLPSWHHDPDYLKVLTDFAKIIPPEPSGGT